MRLSSQKEPQRTLSQVSILNDPDKQWQSLYAQIKKTMSGTSEEKQAILRKRILKFFNNYSLDKNRFYVERREVGSNGLESINISSNSILMYGIDFLTENKLEEYFYPFSISIQFYDDSHCSVTFEHLQSLTQAVYKKMIPNYEIGNMSTFRQLVTSNMQNRLKWFELKPYFQMCFERNLWFRFLTSEDYENKNTTGKSALSDSFLIAKSNFLREIRIKDENDLNSNFNKRRQRSSSSQSQHSRQRSRDARYQNRYDSQNQLCRRCEGVKMKHAYWNKHDKRDCFHKENKRFPSRNQNIYDDSENRNYNNFDNNGNSLDSNRKQKQNNNKSFSPRQKLGSTNNNSIKSSISRQRKPSSDSFRFDISSKKSTFSEQSDDSLMLNSLVDELQKYTFEEDSKKFESNLSQIKSFSSSMDTKNSMKSDCMKMQEELSIFQINQQE